MKILDYLYLGLTLIIALILTIQPICAIVCSAKLSGFSDWMIPIGCLPVLSLFLASSVCYDVKKSINNKF